MTDPMTPRLDAAAQPLAEQMGVTLDALVNEALYVHEYLGDHREKAESIVRRAYALGAASMQELAAKVCEDEAKRQYDDATKAYKIGLPALASDHSCRAVFGTNMAARIRAMNTEG